MTIPFDDSSTVDTTTDEELCQAFQEQLPNNEADNDLANESTLPPPQQQQQVIGPNNVLEISPLLSMIACTSIGVLVLGSVLLGIFFPPALGYWIICLIVWIFFIIPPIEVLIRPTTPNEFPLPRLLAAFMVIGILVFLLLFFLVPRFDGVWFTCLFTSGFINMCCLIKVAGTFSVEALGG